MSEKQPLAVRQSSFGARMFYFGMYLGFYICVVKYPSGISKNLESGQYFSVFFYLALHIFTIYLFLTAGKNPGFAEPDKFHNDSEESKDLNNSQDIELGTLVQTAI